MNVVEHISHRHAFTLPVSLHMSEVARDARKLSNVDTSMIRQTGLLF